MYPTAKTILICIASGLALDLLDIPLPYLFGSLGGCLIGALAGMKLVGTPLMSTISRTMLGVAIGTSISWPLINNMMIYWVSLAIIPFYVALLGMIGLPYFRRICGYDFPTAFYAAMPGGLQDMVIFGIEAGANPRALSLIHATRVLVLVTIAPVVLIQIFGLTLDQPLGVDISAVSSRELIIQLLAGIVGWRLFKALRVFGASVLGPMVVAAILMLSGVLTQRPPQEVIVISQFFIGIGIGVHYVGITLAELRKDILAAFGYILILGAVAAAVVAGISRFSPLPASDLFLAFWPAGQAELAVLSLAAGAAVGVVVLHHVVRICFVILGAPIVSKILNRASATWPS